MIELKTPAEIDHARRLVAAFEAGQLRGEATINFEGLMVDGPVVKAALAVLAGDITALGCGDSVPPGG